MAKLTTSNEQLQVAQPSRFIANRQANDLSGFGRALDGAVQRYAGVAAARRSEENARAEIASSTTAQKLILQSEQSYVDSRNKALAEGQWNQETALQL